MDVRPLTAGDLEGALALSRSASWNQNAEDWQRVLSLCASFGLETDEGVLAASVSVACYGADLAWIGMVLTLPEYRGRGYASTLLRTAMEHALGAGIRVLKLDATTAGAPVYRKFGFEPECEVERWLRRPPPATVPAASGDSDEGEPDWDLDRAAFGAGRKDLLLSFPERYLEPFGHAMHRPGLDASQFGPCVAQDAETARSLALRAVSTTQQPVYWDLFSAHYAAKQLAHEAGFAPFRRLLRMSYQGLDMEAGQDPSLVYALSSFEWG